MESTVQLDRIWGKTELPVFVFCTEEDVCRPVYHNERADALCPAKEAAFMTMFAREEEAESFRRAVRHKEERKGPLFCHIGDAVYSAVLFDREGYCVCMLQEAGEYYRENQKAMDEAIIANRAKTSFLSEMSHDIRTPMNAIIGMTDIAIMQKDVPQKVRDCLDKIKVASGHMMSLINEVLDMSRIESGKIVLQPDEVDLADILHEILIVAKPQADAGGIRFEFGIGCMDRECVWMDGVRFKQICLNLLSNAIKFTPRGGSVELFWEVRRTQEAGQVALYMRVKDSGIGMSREFLGRVFNPFEREQGTAVNKIQGSGLGMAITKNLVEMMGGAITVESEPQKGTCFEVRIPLRIGESYADIRKNALSRKRVLLLDGDDKRAKSLTGMLDGFGVSVDWVRRAQQAVSLINDAELSDWEYFAFLTVEKAEDVEMVLFLQEIRNRLGSRLPILMLSENDWSQTEYLFTCSGVDAFVPMPLFANRVFAALYEFTEEGKAERNSSDMAEEINFSGKNILLVEDNEINREIALEILGRYGMKIETAQDGAQAVAWFERSEPFSCDLIFMDIQMPVMNGLDATREVRKLARPDAKEVPIVAMTANAFMEDVQRSLDAGMNGHISKPLDLEQIGSCLKRFLGRVS